MPLRPGAGEPNRSVRLLALHVFTVIKEHKARNTPTCVDTHVWLCTTPRTIQQAAKAFAVDNFTVVREPKARNTPTCGYTHVWPCTTSRAFRQSAKAFAVDNPAL